MAKSSPQIFFINWLVKKACKRFYINITVCVGITVHWSETFFIVFHKENSVFVNIFEHFWSILSHLLDFGVKAFTFGVDYTIQWRLISLGATPPVEFERNFQYGLILFCYSYTFCWVFFASRWFHLIVVSCFFFLSIWKIKNIKTYTNIY